MECKSVIATPSGHYPPNAHCSLPEGSGTATEWNLNIIVTHTQRTTTQLGPSPFGAGGNGKWKMGNGAGLPPQQGETEP